MDLGDLARTTELAKRDDRDIVRAVFGFIEDLRKIGPLDSFARGLIMVALGVGTEVAVRVFVPRFTARAIRRTSQIIDLERRRRSATAINVSASVARLVVWLMVFISLLAEINVNVGPILAGAGVMGAALAFGAQNYRQRLLGGVLHPPRKSVHVG